MLSNYKIVNLKKGIGDPSPNPEKNQERRRVVLNPDFFYSTVTDFAKFLGLSTSKPFSLEI